MEPPRIDRREFVRRIELASLGLVCGALPVITSGCASFRYLSARDEVDRLVISREAFANGPYALVTSPRTPKPVYLRLLSSGELSAVLAECTHRGCQPEPAGDRLACPCHGSEFSHTGDVLQGPADRPLTRFRVTTDEESISIWIPAS